jgi:predicted  nucleic acid-binding Zn-ribbon protein
MANDHRSGADGGASRVGLGKAVTAARIPLNASLDQQRALLQLQAHDSAIDRLQHRRGSLPEDARLAELAEALASVAQLSAERQGNLATVQRDQSRLEHEIDMVTAKAANEEARAVSGKVTSPKELTAIQEEVASLKRRQGTLEDELLELMEQRETLEAELAELATRREGFTAEQAQVTKARDAALVGIDRELEVERAARDGITSGVGEQLRALYDQVRARQGGIGAAALVGNTCQGCRVSISPVELAALRKLPPEEVKRCENCRRILVVE